MNIKSKSHQYDTYTCHSNYSSIILHNSTMPIQILHFTDINIVHTLLFTLQKSIFASWMINSFYIILKPIQIIYFTEINIVHCVTHVTKRIRYSLHERSTHSIESSKYYYYYNLQQHRIPQRETRHNDLKTRHSSARNTTTIFGRGEVGVIDKFSKWRSIKFI